MNYIAKIKKIIYCENSNLYKIYFCTKESKFTSYFDVPISDAKNIALARENINSNKLKTYNVLVDMLALLTVKISKIIINRKNSRIVSNIYFVFHNKEYKLNVNFVDSIIVSIKTNSNLYISSDFFSYNDSQTNNVYKEVSDHDCKEPNKLNNLKNILKVLIKNEDYESAVLVRNKIDEIIS